MIPYLLTQISIYISAHFKIMPNCLRGKWGKTEAVRSPETIVGQRKFPLLFKTDRV